MKNWEFHSAFQLNGRSFSSVDELITFATTLSEDIGQFMKDWFSDSDNISIRTSGSTGKPKQIVLRKEHMLNSAKTTGQFFELTQDTKALLCLPIQYIAGKMMVVRSLCLGWHLDVAIASVDPLKEVNQTYDFSAMIPMQVKNSLGKLSGVKKLIVGGGEVDTDLLEKIQNVSTQIFATYGMTETCTHIAVRQLNHGLWSHFKVLPGIGISQDERNCLIISAPKVAASDLITNDIIEMRGQTEFIWKGRYDNVINSGGIKLHPEEIERKLGRFVKRRFFVSGIKDNLLGEKLVLVIEGENYELSDQVFQSLTKYEIPKEVHFVKAFVETETQKVQRKKTLELL